MGEAGGVFDGAQDYLAEGARIAADYAVAILRLVLAAACGGVVGWQRERSDKAAGLRTHMLLAVGACLFTLVGLRVAEDEFMRLVQGMVTGTGFISAGIIFRQGVSIRGLTTAVGLWVMGAVGMAVGAGEYFLAILTTLVAVAIMAGFVRIEERIGQAADASVEGDSQEER